MKKKYLYHFISPIITVIILMICFFIKRIYPFGNNTIGYGDLAQCFLTNIAYMCDAIKNHNFMELFYTNLIYDGSKLFAFSGALNIFNLLFIVFKKENIIYDASIIFIVKVFLSALSAQYCFDRIFTEKKNRAYNVLFSVLYALSSYTLLFYTLFFWLDVMIVFPLIILSLKNMFFENKISSAIVYTLCLTIALILAYQLVYMILFFILISTFIATKIYKEVDVKRFLLSIGICTVIAFIISSVALLPSLRIYTQSNRFSRESTDRSNSFGIKLNIFLLYGVIIYGNYHLLKYVKKDRNVKFIFITLIAVAILPLLFEGINLIWHGGSYICFPFRHGFISVFMLTLGSNYYFQKYSNERTVKSRQLAILIVLAYLCIMLYGNALGMVCSYMPAYYITITTDALLLLSAIIICLIFDSIKDNLKVIIIVTFIQVLLCTLAYVGIDQDRYYSINHTDESLIRANKVLENFQNEIDFDTEYKYKDMDNIFVENTSIYMRIPSNSAWVYSDIDSVKCLLDLGYSVSESTEIAGNGGTVFSDALIGYGYAFSDKELNTVAYEKLNSFDNINLYKYKYRLPYITKYKNIPLKKEAEMDAYDYQNSIYQTMFEKDGNILEKIDSNKIDLDYENKIGQLKLVVMGKKQLYLYIPYFKEFITNIYVNGEKFDLSGVNFDKEYNKYYPEFALNGILDLGYYENENVDIKFSLTSDNVNKDNLIFALLDYNKYTELFDYKSEEVTFNTYKNEININAEKCTKGEKLFIPIAYDDHMKMTINGESKNVDRALLGFMSVQLEDGTNDIKIWYDISYMRKYAFISVVGVLLLVIFIIMYNKMTNNKLLKNIAYYMYICLMYVFIFIVYIYGFIKTIMLLF